MRTAVLVLCGHMLPALLGCTADPMRDNGFADEALLHPERAPRVCELAAPRQTQLDATTLHGALDGVRATLRLPAPLADLGATGRRATNAGDDCLLAVAPHSGLASACCLPCHAARTVAHGPDGDRPAHPTSVDYDRAVKHGRLPLRPLTRLPHAIVLVDGRIECTTCHRRHTNLRSQLALDRLCTGCHLR